MYITQGNLTLRDAVASDAPTLKNMCAQHVYEKVGMRKVGERQDAWTDQLGVPQSVADYEIIRAEFMCRTNG